MRWCNPNATFALNGLDQDRRGFRPNRLPDGLKVRERQLVEAFRNWAEAFQIFLLAAGREGCERTPMKCTLESNEALALRPPRCVLIFARHLDAAFHGLSPGIAEENQVRESLGA